MLGFRQIRLDWERYISNGRLGFGGERRNSEGEGLEGVGTGESLNGRQGHRGGYGGKHEVTASGTRGEEGMGGGAGIRAVHVGLRRTHHGEVGGDHGAWVDLFRVHR